MVKRRRTVTGGQATAPPYGKKIKLINVHSEILPPAEALTHSQQRIRIFIKSVMFHTDRQRHWMKEMMLLKL